MYELEFKKLFKKDSKRMKKRGKKFSKLNKVLEMLLQKQTLPKKYRPHMLSGNWGGKWECHIEPDWLLIYEYSDDSLILHRTGSHSDLFK